MSPRPAGGFTLVELVLAMTIAAFVTTSAVAALGLLGEADVRTTQRMEETVGVQRAMFVFRRDLADAAQIDVAGARCLATLRDGTTVAYESMLGGTELHRIVATSAAAAKTALDTASAAAATAAAQYTERGHLRDGAYRTTAVLQGARAIAFTPITSPRTGTTIGVRLAVDHATAAGATTAQCLAMSLQLLEAHAKP